MDDPVDLLRTRDSSVRLSISVSVEYNRKRAQVGDKWEARFSTVGLLLVGAGIVFVALFLIARVIGLVP